MNESSPPTRILFVDNNETSFQIWQCIAYALDGLPPIELVHAQDTTDGLNMLNNLKPDAIVLNLCDSDSSERESFLDNLIDHHPPVIIYTDTEDSQESTNDKIHYVSRTGSLGCIHKALLTATSAAKQQSQHPNSDVYYH